LTPGLVTLGEKFNDGRRGEETLKPGVHVAGIGEVGEAADASDGRLRLDVLLQFRVVAAPLDCARLEEVEQTITGSRVSIVTLWARISLYTHKYVM
jgi:hypothetical protein